MIEKKDIEKLASLARITIPEAEIEKTRQDIEKILAYVSQINDANDLMSETDLIHGINAKNVMRADSDPHETGKFTDMLLSNVPKVDNGYVKVKKIL